MILIHDEVLMGAKAKLGGEAMVDRTKVKVWAKTRISEQTLCEVFTSPLHECIIGMDIMSDWYCKTECIKVHLGPILIRHAKWELLELSEPTEVVNLRQCRISGGQKEIITSITN